MKYEYLTQEDSATFQINIDSIMAFKRFSKIEFWRSVGSQLHNLGNKRNRVDTFDKVCKFLGANKKRMLEYPNFSEMSKKQIIDWIMCDGEFAYDYKNN